MKTLKPEKHLGGFALLPPSPDKCQICAVAHEPEQAHNQQSLFYQYKFFGENGRWPTWNDAIAHCAPEVKAQWVKHLTDLGVKLSPPDENQIQNTKT